MWRLGHKHDWTYRGMFCKGCVVGFALAHGTVKLTGVSAEMVPTDTRCDVCRKEYVEFMGYEWA